MAAMVIAVPEEKEGEYVRADYKFGPTICKAGAIYQSCCTEKEKKISATSE